MENMVRLTDFVRAIMPQLWRDFLSIINDCLRDIRYRDCMAGMRLASRMALRVYTGTDRVPLVVMHVMNYGCFAVVLNLRNVPALLAHPRKVASA